MSEGPNYRLRNIEVFKRGNHRGKTYTDRDLDDLVANFQRLSSPRNRNPLLRVPGVVGHKERDLGDDSLPAGGWVSDVRKKGDRILADFEDVSPEMADLLTNKRYTSFSAEVYDNPPGDCDGWGKTFRRMAYLGGAQPQIKGLAPAGAPERMSERFACAPLTIRSSHAVRMPDGCFAVFSEVSTMIPDEAGMTPGDPGQQQPPDRDALLQKLAEQHGMDPAVIGDMQDHHLAAVGDALDAKDAAAQGDDYFDAMAARYGEADPQVPEDEEGMQKYRERWRRFAEVARKYGEACSPTKDTDDDKDTPMAKMSEAQLEALVERVLTRKADGAIARVEKFNEQLVTAKRAETVDGIIDELGRTGKLPPAERKGEREELLALASDATLHKFSEAGKDVSATLFDRRVARLRARPSKFAERFGAAPRAGAAAADDEELEKVERFSEDPAFAHALDANDQTPADYVDRFKALKKANPRLTAAQYGVRE